jgi:DNA-binding HxlR family transcriptional regulator
VAGVAGRKSYNQNCPIARGLDVLGERWTLLILRELIGGARRYGDMRAALPGIATNLLADRLRELEEAGLICRSELPPPVARTVYTLSDEGWRKVPPVIQAVATFGLDLLEPTDSVLTPLNGFLAGILLGFDPARASDGSTSCSVEIDGRRFGFAVTRQRDRDCGRLDHRASWRYRRRAEGRVAAVEVRGQRRRDRSDARGISAGGRSRAGTGQPHLAVTSRLRPVVAASIPAG